MSIRKKAQSKPEQNDKQLEEAWKKFQEKFPSSPFLFFQGYPPWNQKRDHLMPHHFLKKKKKTLTFLEEVLTPLKLNYLELEAGVIHDESAKIIDDHAFLDMGELSFAKTNQFFFRSKYNKVF